jgi:hypothetical protein
MTTRGRLAPIGAALTATATANQTTLTMSGDWSSSVVGGTFPFRLYVAGELVEVTSYASGSTTWNVTRALNGVRKAQAVGAPVTMAEPFRLALGTAITSGIASP